MAQQPARGPGRVNRAQRTAEFLGLGPPPDQAAAKLGKVLFDSNCASCHGADARGARGPNLLRSLVVLHDDKGAAIGEVVTNGRPGGGMPAFTDLTKEQIYQISEFLHELVYLATNRAMYSEVYASQQSHSTGDVHKGTAFFAAHCASCHSAEGDLAHIGAKYPQVSAIQGRILWPSSRKPLEATVTTQSGEKVTGTLVKFDDFDVALYDASGHYHYWPRQQVTVSVPDPLHGHRALLPEYTDADIHNLAAYLMTLK